jgi:hypothetical protein
VVKRNMDALENHLAKVPNSSPFTVVSESLARALAANDSKHMHSFI